MAFLNATQKASSFWNYFTRNPIVSAHKIYLKANLLVQYVQLRQNWTQIC